MLAISLEPPLPPRATTGDYGVLQTLHLLDGDQPIGLARWHCPSPIVEGVAQLVELTIAPSHRRQGHGRRLLTEVITQVKTFFTGQHIPPLRLWTATQQKSHLPARAFLTACGFHHTATFPKLLRNQDQLIYVLDLD